MKKTLSLLLAFLMLFSSLFVVANAVEAEQSVDEIQAQAIMRTTVSFRVKLHSEAAFIRVIDPFTAPIVGIAPALKSCTGDTVCHDRVAVVLAGNESTPISKTPDRLITAPVTEFEFDGLPAHSQRSKLVTETDTEDGYLPDQLSDLCDLVNIFRRIPWPVGDKGD